jgi:hypothetical protein
MRNFALLNIDQVKGRIKFYKLVINGECAFDRFCENFTRKQDEKKLIRILARMESLSNHGRLGPSQFSELARSANDKIKDYEIKVKPYRVYFFKDDCGYIVVLGGTKNSQPRNINNLRNIKQEYFESKKGKQTL